MGKNEKDSHLKSNKFAVLDNEHTFNIYKFDGEDYIQPIVVNMCQLESPNSLQ